MKIILKAFPGHKGRPGQVGGSSPKSGGVSADKLTTSDIVGSIERTALHGDITTVFPTKRTQNLITKKYEDEPNEYFPKQWTGKSGVPMRANGASITTLYTTLENMGFKGTRNWTKHTTWTHPSSSTKVEFLPGYETGNHSYRHFRVYGK